MSDVKPMTKAEWEEIRNRDTDPLCLYEEEITATIDALFEYRERTREWEDYFCGSHETSDDIAKELGLERGNDQ